MRRKKIKTYADRLLADKKFKDEFEREYENLIVSEKIAQLRHKAKLTQAELAGRVHTTKSAISRYESNEYKGYSIALLQKIAAACNAELKIEFVSKK